MSKAAVGLPVREVEQQLHQVPAGPRHAGVAQRPQLPGEDHVEAGAAVGHVAHVRPRGGREPVGRVGAGRLRGGLGGPGQLVGGLCGDDGE